MIANRQVIAGLSVFRISNLKPGGVVHVCNGEMQSLRPVWIYSEILCVKRLKRKKILLGFKFGLTIVMKGITII